MIPHDDVCYLVAESPTAHGIFDPPEETPRMVYCQVRSIGGQEYYRALENKLHPSVMFILSDAIEYGGEKIVLWTPRGAEEALRYRVIRTYDRGDGFELYCEEATIDARAEDPPEDAGGEATP